MKLEMILMKTSLSAFQNIKNQRIIQGMYINLNQKLVKEMICFKVKERKPKFRPIEYRIKK